ncbi:hypothetical protein IEQ34_024874 [Dendrobium chrysotoxum]|uniref:Cytochrome oxidase subunit II copper A binding domain-containing protein n=1 Tax=Dendrobium chrysotoxum TaxID=161865 RepID=A0AAV7FRR7_DENCH|nr:hypothetical protein IEQ34_024874 [Dendrobium chrysotoxum]
MFSAILALLVMPFTDLSNIRGIQFRPLSKIEQKHVETPFIELGQLSTALYFAHYIFIVPFVTLLENSLMDLALAENQNKVSANNATPQMEGLEELHNNIMFYLAIILFALSLLLNYYILWMSYQYPDFTNNDDEFVEFDSYIVPESDLELGKLRMLEVDNRVIIPELTHTRFIVGGADVIHSYACPSLGIKCDAYPGRLNQSSVYLNREVLFVISGASLLIASADLGSIYLCIELQSFSLYIISSLHRNSESSTGSALTYFLLGGLSSCFILLGIALIYANSGLTNLDVIGTVLGLSQNRIKRLLAYSTISHIGFILLALIVHTLDSYQAYLFYIIQYIFTNLNAFMIIIAMGFYLYLHYTNNTEFNSLSEKNNSPIQLINQLKGLPPLVGFFGKLAVLTTALDNDKFILVLTAILSSVIGAVYYLTIIKTIYFEDKEYKRSHTYVEISLSNSFSITLGNLHLSLTNIGLYLIITTFIIFMYYLLATNYNVATPNG